MEFITCDSCDKDFPEAEVSWGGYTCTTHGIWHLVFWCGKCDEPTETCV